MVNYLDKIIINDMELYAFHGVDIREKELGQRFTVSAVMYLDTSDAAENDDLSKTVSYVKVCKDIERLFTEKSYDLIETCAEVLAKQILIDNPLVQKVLITVKKPWAPIGKILDYAAVEIERSWHQVYIGIGSNIGDKEKNINDAIAIILKNDMNILVEKADLIETKPVGYTNQDNFINTVIHIKTLLKPDKLMEELLKIEILLKRERIIKWGPRTIDLDILLYDNIISCDKNIVIPHPKMHERLFVLKPLMDIAPFIIHPLLNKRIIDLYEEVSLKQKLI